MLVESDAKVEPPVSVSHIQWLDMRDWSEREAKGGLEWVPLSYEKCSLPAFLQGKLYADFTDPATYEEVLAKLLRKLRIR